MKRWLMCALLLVVGVPRAFGWGREGHRMVALVAADYLTPVASANVRALLGRETMADVASFADDYRFEHPETGPWHYVDIPLAEKGYVAARDCPETCVVERIPYFEGVLRDAASTKAQREFALKMLIHLIGDLHQPMHAIGEARGGNSVKVILFGTRQCGERQTCNLHGTWDEGLIEHGRMSEKKYVAGLEEEIATLALEKKPVGTPVAWANASHRAAVEAWVPNGALIDEDYYQAELPTMKRELELGGLHLADVLNEVFVVAPAGGEVVTPNKGAPVLTPREH